MANYAIIENGAIVDYKDYVPAVWNNITNFNIYENDEEQLKSFGWYKIVKRIPEYDSGKYRLSHPIYSFENDVVYEDYELQEIIVIPPKEKKKRDEFAISQLQQFILNALQQSDWTQLKDVSESKTVEWNQKWSDYRKGLRELLKKSEEDDEFDAAAAVIPTNPDAKPTSIKPQRLDIINRLTHRSRR